MVGRHPKPGALKERQGNPGNRPIPAEPPQSVADPATAALPFAKLSEHARLAYEIVGGALRNMNFLRASDEPLLLRYADGLARFWKVTAALDAFGSETYETDSQHGKMQRMRPEFLVQERLAKRLESMEDRLGLSPMARQQYLLRMASAGNRLPFDPQPSQTRPTAERQPDHAPTPGVTSPKPAPALGFLKPATDARH